VNRFVCMYVSGDPIYVCKYVCVYAYMYVYIYVCMYVCGDRSHFIQLS
jgi:hypothetical protein